VVTPKNPKESPTVRKQGWHQGFEGGYNFASGVKKKFFDPHLLLTWWGHVAHFIIVRLKMQKTIYKPHMK